MNIFIKEGLKASKFPSLNYNLGVFFISNIFLAFQ